MVLFSQKSSPFLHQLVAPTFETATEAALLDLLDSLEWKRCESDFYRFDIPVRVEDRRRMHDLLCNSRLLGESCTVFERVFHSVLAPMFRLEVHRYGTGCGIGPHTDAAMPEVRYVVNLNRGWKFEDGAVWILASNSALQNKSSYLPSLSNTGFAFSTNLNTFHALTTYSGKPIYSLTLCFARL